MKNISFHTTVMIMTLLAQSMDQSLDFRVDYAFFSSETLK